MSTSTFSYAQAAKGQSIAQAATLQQSPNQSQTPSVTSNQHRDANGTNASTRTPSVAVSTSSNDIDSFRSGRSASVKPEILGQNGVEMNQEEANTEASVAGSLSSSKVGVEPASVNGTVKSTESRGRSMTTGSDTGDHNEMKKGRKTRKGKSTEKEMEASQELEKEAPPSKVELSEAPLPSVNIWVQRQQAQNAKRADLPASSGANPMQSTETKARAPNNEAVVDSSRGTSIGKQGARKDNEPSRNGTIQGPRRAAPRGARGHERQPETNLIPNNPVSWPTPETAAVNLKTQPQTQTEKPDKEEKEDGNTAKPRQKKEWVQLTDFVPTVKFETNLPTRGPRGGRPNGSRGGRDAPASHQTANSTERVQDSHAGPRPNGGSKREGGGPREGRRNVTNAEQSRLPRESTSDTTNSEQRKPNHSGVVNGTSHVQPGQTPTLSQQPEENVKGSDSQKDLKNQNNREAHPQGQTTSNHRNAERPRGGARGRGGFSQNNPNGVSHYAQNSYSSPHHTYQYQPNGTRHPSYPPMSYAFPGQAGPGQRKPTAGPRGRGSGRMQALPTGLTYDTNIYPPPSGGMYSFDAASNLLQLAQTQVEYYFSDANCVKDWYLRTHMDSQGFVPISVIAAFPRIRELLVDPSILRQSCITSSVLELVMGPDGVERVRSKEGWEKWVIQDMSLRNPTARHDGPSTWHTFNNGFHHPMMSPHYTVEAPPLFSPTIEHGFVNGNYAIPPLNVPGMNGVNGSTRAHESQLSAAVPEFSPSTATFNRLKSVLPNGSQDAKAPAHKDTHGVVSLPGLSAAMTNGVMQDQLQANVDSLHGTNGADLRLDGEGNRS